MAWQLDIRLYINEHTLYSYDPHDVVNINNLRIFFNNNYYLFDVMWANQSLDLIIIVARFIVMLFSSVGQNKRGQLVTYLFRWRYTIKILIWV